MLAPIVLFISVITDVKIVARRASCSDPTRAWYCTPEPPHAGSQLATLANRSRASTPAFSAATALERR